MNPVDAWLPQSNNWGDFSVESQEIDESSPLNLYRQALKIRKSRPGLGDGTINWLEVNQNVVSFSRPGGFVCYLNLGEPIELPENAKVLVSSQTLSNNLIPTDTAVWFELK